jgi:hypothetical protein
MITFNPDKDLVLSKMKIDWKSEEVNLCKKFPAPARSGEDDMEVEDMGSFFNLFERQEDDLSVNFSPCGAFSPAYVFLDR